MIDGSDDDSAAAVVSHQIDANFEYLSISVMPKLPHVGKFKMNEWIVALLAWSQSYNKICSYFILWLIVVVI